MFVVGFFLFCFFCLICVVFLFDRYQLSVVSLTVWGILAKHLVLAAEVFQWELCIYSSSWLLLSRLYCCCYCCCCCWWWWWLNSPFVPISITDIFRIAFNYFPFFQQSYIPPILYRHYFFFLLCILQVFENTGWFSKQFERLVSSEQSFVVEVFLTTPSIRSFLCDIYIYVI